MHVQSPEIILVNLKKIVQDFDVSEAPTEEKKHLINEAIQQLRDALEPFAFVESTDASWRYQILSIAIAIQTRIEKILPDQFQGFPNTGPLDDFHAAARSAQLKTEVENISMMDPKQLLAHIQAKGDECKNILESAQQADEWDMLTKFDSFVLSFEQITSTLIRLRADKELFHRAADMLTRFVASFEKSSKNTQHSPVVHNELVSLCSRLGHRVEILGKYQ